ncbi:MAG: hypothetical protein L0H74_00225 [Brachybacterium sp.]|nr:hypothetical protein [Brachybacterium sp.]
MRKTSVVAKRYGVRAIDVQERLREMGVLLEDRGVPVVARLEGLEDLTVAGDLVSP